MVGRRVGKLDAHLGAAAGALADDERAAETFDDVLGDRQAEAGAAALRREVWIEDARQVRLIDADAGVGDDDRDPAPAARVVPTPGVWSISDCRRDRRRFATPGACRRRRGGRDRVPSLRVDDCRALTIRLTSATRSRSASVVTTPSEGSRSSRTAAPGVAWAAAADSRQSALRSAGASSNRIGRAKSSTSLTMRLSRATSSSMSAAASRSVAGRTSGCRSVCSAALMIISGLRTSCAMTVDSRPSDDSRSFCDDLALKARDRSRSAC